MKIWVIATALFGLAAVPTFAAVTVSPAAPLPGDTVRIQVANRFGYQASVRSASISRSGNTFVIQQVVGRSCSSQSNPLVASEFDVGPLPPGTYTVVANLTLASDLNPLGCNFEQQLTQTATFTIVPSIPALGTSALVLLAAALAFTALVVMKG